MPFSMSGDQVNAFMAQQKQLKTERAANAVILNQRMARGGDLFYEGYKSFGELAPSQIPEFRMNSILQPVQPNTPFQTAPKQAIVWTKASEQNAGAWSQFFPNSAPLKSADSQFDFFGAPSSSNSLVGAAFKGAQKEAGDFSQNKSVNDIFNLLTFGAWKPSDNSDAWTKYVIDANAAKIKAESDLAEIQRQTSITKDINEVLAIPGDVVEGVKDTIKETEAGVEKYVLYGLAALLIMNINK